MVGLAPNVNATVAGDADIAAPKLKAGGAAISIDGDTGENVGENVGEAALPSFSSVVSDGFLRGLPRGLVGFALPAPRANAPAECSAISVDADDVESKEAAGTGSGGSGSGGSGAESRRARVARAAAAVAAMALRS